MPSAINGSKSKGNVGGKSPSSSKVSSTIASKQVTLHGFFSKKSLEAPTPKQQQQLQKKEQQSVDSFFSKKNKTKSSSLQITSTTTTKTKITPTKAATFLGQKKARVKEPSKKVIKTTTTPKKKPATPTITSSSKRKDVEVIADIDADEAMLVSPSTVDEPDMEDTAVDEKSQSQKLSPKEKGTHHQGKTTATTATTTTTTTKKKKRRVILDSDDEEEEFEEPKEEEEKNSKQADRNQTTRGSNISKKTTRLKPADPPAKKTKLSDNNSNNNTDKDSFKTMTTPKKMTTQKKTELNITQVTKSTTITTSSTSTTTTSPRRPAKTAKMATGWGFLNGSFPATPAKKKRTTTAADPSARGTGVKTYTEGDDLPIISHPQEMFDDMVANGLCRNGKDTAILTPLLETLHDRPLRVATMCSGTESPVLALDMLTKALEDFSSTSLSFKHNNNNNNSNNNKTRFRIPIRHVFSCEIEPFKQAYIERNFQPPLLFRDIRELGNRQAHTAYGGLVDVPNTPGCVDILIAGTSCVDYSNLNNEKKTIEQSGESGQTFRGMMDWIQKAQPPIVILENVVGAPWEKKVQVFENIGYEATYDKGLDTKRYYIPHTRQRGYLVAVKKSAAAATVSAKSNGKKKYGAVKLGKWKDLVKNQLSRPASGALDAFMLPNDDPRVLRGRARLSNGKSDASENRVDWGKCELRHLYARASEELGEKRPLTGWSDSGNTSMPGFAWNEWVNAQVHRIHDLMDINTMRLAKLGIDGTHKTMVWNLSQNVDRETMGRLGLCSCLTPSGVPYVSNRGGPLVGEELLMLQGIPAEDLILTKQTEDQLKDLAGNAMSTTVVGACMLGALVLFHDALDRCPPEMNSLPGGNHIVPSLVPRPLGPASPDISITRDFGSYQRSLLDLGQKTTIGAVDTAKFFEQVSSSSRKCISESGDKALPTSDLLLCKECGHTSCTALGIPARKYEEHVYEPLSEKVHERTDPSVFRKTLLEALPMRIGLCGFDTQDKPDEVDERLWCDWKDALGSATTGTTGSPNEFRFAQLTRSHCWNATYLAANGARLELNISGRGAIWFLFATPVAERGKLRDALERPVARMNVTVDSDSELSLLGGVWEVCYPVVTKIELVIQGEGEKTVESWDANLGIKGGYENGVQFEYLKISVNTDGFDSLAESLDGIYKVLPKCGAACGSLHKLVRKHEGRQVTDKEACFFFLESGRCTTADTDAFVFAATSHRTSYREYRDVILRVDPSYRPGFEKAALGVKQRQVVPARIPGQWKIAQGARMDDGVHKKSGGRSGVTAPTAKLRVPMVAEGWKSSAEILSCEVAMGAQDKLFKQCTRYLQEDEAVAVAVNLQKSKNLFRDLAFVTSRVSIPTSVAEDWMSLHSTKEQKLHTEPCSKCSPRKPAVKWTLISKGGRHSYAPIDDGREASIYEQALKNRPNPWNVHLNIAENGFDKAALQVQIGCNAFSLVHRALGLLPDSLPRNALLALPSDSKAHECAFEWRVVPHQDTVTGFENFPKLYLTSNKLDTPAMQPPNFQKWKLRPEQLRSLSWMLAQENSTTPFYEEEVTESVLPTLNWRAEGRVRRPILVRGGIVADEVGYGKTAITLGLIDAAGDAPEPTRDLQAGFLHTKATLVVVPSHLMSQWPKEVKKFLGSGVVTLVIKDMASFNSLRAQDILRADIVIINFTVLSGEKYFKRLGRLAGINVNSLPSKTGGRHFDTVYNECLGGLETRVSNMKKDPSSAFESIEDDAALHAELEEKEAAVRLDGKKAVYKSISEDQTKIEATSKKLSQASKKTTPSKGLRKDGTNDKLAKADRDPWGLSTSDVKRDIGKMKSPPLEMFFWNRIVVDEFHYLADKKDRARVKTLVVGLKSTFRWCLSGTPPHQNFDDVQTLADLLCVQLGVKELLPGSKITKRGGNERSGLERLSDYLETRTMAWHERRHTNIAQGFLDRFVRQNIAEIDEIKCEEHVISVEQPPAEKALYMELETYLKSLEMNNKKALKTKKSSTGDREMRMQRVLEDSSSAAEALLKRAAHFDLRKGESQSALETCNYIIGLRQDQLSDCEDVLLDSIARAIRQRNKILKIQPGWKGTEKVEKGEVQDRLGLFLLDVEKKQSVPGGADGEVHGKIASTLEAASNQVANEPEKFDPKFAEANGEEDDSDDTPSKKRKRSKTGDEDKRPDELRLYDMKMALREHMHDVRSYLKELCGRIRSLRYFRSVRDFQLRETQIKCSGGGPSCCCTRGSGEKSIPKEKAAVLSCCGHVGCLSCLRHHADREKCIDPSCSAQVKSTHVVPAVALGRDSNGKSEKYGAKLTQIVENVRKLVSDGDRVIVFVQFDDLKQKVAEALSESGVKTLQVAGTVQQQTKALDILQKETPDRGDPRVLLLTMDDESSAGVNLTTCNHAVFVHPLLAGSQQQHDAYETQAIGRIRRYGQTKTVHIWRYLAKDTVDEEIYNERRQDK